MKKVSQYLTYGILGLVFLIGFSLFCHNIGNFKLDVTLFIVAVSIFLLATGLVMEYFAMLIFLSVVILLGIAPANVTFSGFVSDGFWLIFAGMPLSVAIKKTGLADRISNFMMRFCKGSYSFLVLGMALFGLLMAFIMPSGMGRVILMIPILVEFARVNGFLPGSKGYNGILLSGLFGTYIAGFAILPSNLPNLILMGSVKSLFHMELIYANYLLLNFPVLGMTKLIFLVIVISWIFNDAPRREILEGVMQSTSFSGAELRLTVYLALVLIAWLTDSITHLSPAWPALIMAVICLLPGIGIIDHKKFIKESNLEPLFYVGGLIGLSAVVNYTGLGSLLGEKLLSILPLSSTNHVVNYYLLTLLSTLVGTFTTLPGVPAIISPLSTNIATMTHMSLYTVLMTQVVGFSNFILPYQAPPILVALRLANIKLSSVTKLSLIMFVISIIVLTPLDYAWWKILGVF